MQMGEEEVKYESWVEGQQHVSLFSSELQREKHNNRKMLPGATQRKSDSKKKGDKKNKVIVCHPGMTKRAAFPTQTRCQGALTADERSQTGKSGRCGNKGIWTKRTRERHKEDPPTHSSIHPASLPLTRLQKPAAPTRLNTVSTSLSLSLHCLSSRSLCSPTRPRKVCRMSPASQKGCGRCFCFLNCC